MSIRKVFVGAFLLLCLQGCGSMRFPTGAPIVSPSQAEPNYAVVRVFFATDRDLTGKPKPAEMFGVGRSLLRHGTADVSIPRDHKTGELEGPSILRFEFRPDPEKHVVLLQVNVDSRDSVLDSIRKDGVERSAQRSAFIFVHGYNVSFEDAARRTAQMSYDLRFDGAATFYSWPSRANPLAYTVDEDNSEWGKPNLKGFLDDLFTRSGAQSIYLIAHSMGNRALIGALTDLMAEKPHFQERLREVILAAPDIDAEIFKRDIVPALTAVGKPVTLYVSANDRALAASKAIQGYPRAGDTDGGVIVASGIETIDASDVDTSFLGHSYYADERSVLSDLFHLFQGNRPDRRFGLQPVEVQDGRYWRIVR
jgi:esterase/lipase superfamily enzyme